MWRSGWLVRHGWKLGLAALAVASGPQVGFAEQPLKRLPEDVVSFSFAWVALPQAMAEVTEDHGPLAGASWGVVKGSSEAVARIVNLVDEEPSASRVPRGETDRSPAWLNIDNGRSRSTRREPALLRYTF
jgi:hypothetical protein